MPMVILALGIGLFTFVSRLPSPDPQAHACVTTHLAAVSVLVSLMGAGLALDRRRQRVAGERHGDDSFAPETAV